MHKTETVDFAMCVSGEIYLVLDDSEVYETGDTASAVPTMLGRTGLMKTAM